MFMLPAKAIIGCVHLLPTPGAPQYGGDVEQIYTTALSEAEIYLRHGVDALIVENFRDWPFYPDSVPAETIATVAGVTREIVRLSSAPVGVAILRNDAMAALAVAAATGATFVRVNVHIGAVHTAQGVLSGNSHETLRLRRRLMSEVAVFADARVKHSQPFAYPDLRTEIRDLSGVADGVIVSGELTGTTTSADDLLVARDSTQGTVLAGSGVTPDNLPDIYPMADGFIVGSYFKVDGVPTQLVDETRVVKLMECMRSLRQDNGSSSSR